MNADNENEADDPLPFQSLADITAKLLQPAKKKDEQGSDDRDAAHDDEQRAAEYRQYVEQRLRDFEAFERRANGRKH